MKFEYEPYFTEEEMQSRFPLSLSVTEPSVVRDWTPDQLEALAKEYREYLIEVCSKNGGHLGPGLGVIELTLALHKVFDSPNDRIVWDIGHQAYPHKLMTGRFRELQSLRTEKGVSGFCRREESAHDIFGAGHAGTSISVAVGISESLRKAQKKNKAIAIIGDAALTSGMAYEGLHQEVKYKKNLIVILNDNEMSIAPNVGAINQFLSRKMSSPFLDKLQDEIKQVAGKIPLVGEDVVQVLGQIKHRVKNMMMPSVIFEALGFHYYGPIDGHDLNALIEVFENVKEREEPIFLHIITEKGRGYAPAIADKETFHGCGPYDKESGKIIKQADEKPGYNKIYSKSLEMIAKADPKVVAITAAMPAGTGLSSFEKALPDQFYDVGISEQHAVTFAGGLAIEGYKPHVAIYSTFMQRAYDQIIHDICIQNLNVKFGMDRAGFVGADGATHNGNYDIAFMRAIPNMHICAPKDERELQELLVAMDKHEGPACIRYPRGAGVGVPLHQELADVPEIPWGSAEIVYMGHQESRFDALQQRSVPWEWVDRLLKNEKLNVDVALIAYGSSVYDAVKASQELFKKGIRSMVVNLRFVKPLDETFLMKLSEICPRWVSVEEHVLMGGVGSCLLEFLEQNSLQSKISLKRLGVPDQFYDQESVSGWKSRVGIDVASIVQSTEAFVLEAAEQKTVAKVEARRTER
jgi:1-deoxy-D-xylulose-5-phosphate synthase